MSLQLAAARVPSPEPGRARFRLVLPTELGLVGEAVEAVVTCCELPDALAQRDRFRLRTVSAEAIANAMCYGNCEDPERMVTIDVEVSIAAITVQVTDEGAGFDPASVPEIVDEQDCHEAISGRGLFMIRHLAEQVRFNRQGNIIWVTLTRC